MAGPKDSEAAEVVERAGEPAQEASFYNVPAFYGSALQGYFAGNDFILVVSRPQPGQADRAPAVRAQPVAVLHLSPGTAKDLFLLMKAQIEQHEKTFGAIETDYSRSLAKKK